MKSLIIIILAFIGYSCSFENEHEKIANEIISFSNTSLNDEIDTEVKYLEFHLIMNEAKVKPWFKKAQKVLEQRDIFIEKTKSTTSQKEIETAYNYCTEHIIKETGAFFKIESVTVLNISEYQNQKLKQKIAIQNILIITKAALYEINKRTTAASSYWGDMNLQINEDTNIKGDYGFTVSSDILKHVSEKHRQVIIDSIFMDKKNISPKYRIKPNYELSSVSFDSLEQGEYIVKGSVRVITSDRLEYDKEFVHKFIIKK